MKEIKQKLWDRLVYEIKCLERTVNWGRGRRDDRCAEIYRTLEEIEGGEIERFI